MRYRLIGVDLDGTMLNRQHRVSLENQRALDRAAAAGAMVVPCTGRAWHESRDVLPQLPGVEVGVFVTGAAVHEARSGDCLNHASLSAALARELIELLEDASDAVLVSREVGRAGHHYLVTGRGPMTANTAMWFAKTGAVVTHRPQVSSEDLEHALRVCLVTDEDRVEDYAQRLRQALPGRVTSHAFAALTMPNDPRRLHILEIFAAGVDKWRGLSWLAERHGVPREAVAVIGDEINDVPMLRTAGLGVAMGNAIDAAKAAAHRVTEDRDAHGVATAIDRMIAGEW